MKLMKKLAGAVTIALALTLTTGLVAPASHASVAVSFDFFYSDLSPHGSWLVSGEYGRVWQPRVYRGGWNPYHDGHWVYTDCGWTWVSDYTWGDVAYHYGTWVDDPRFGWVWVPGYTWAPAWVTFRTGPDYIGWAPVSPSFAVGFSSGGFSFGASFPVATSAFVFVPTHQFASTRLRSYIVPESRRTTIINNTTIVNNLTVENNIIVNRGPDMRTIERATRRTFKPQPIERVARVAPFTSVRRDQLSVARDMGRDRVKVAEPISAQQPLPPRMSDKQRRDFRRNPESSQTSRNDRFRTPTETQAQRQQQDRSQDQRQERMQPQRRQNETRQQEARSSQQEQRQQQDQRQRQEEQRQEKAQQQPREQREQRAQPQQQQQQREQRAQPQHQDRQKQEKATSPSDKPKEEPTPKPSRRAPKKKNPEEEKKKDDGGGTH